MNKKTLNLLAFGLIACVLALPARAQSPLLDDVETRIDQGLARVSIHFTAPIRYLRHFPSDHGEQLQIYFQIVSLDSGQVSLDDEVRKVSATAALPGFTVTYSPPVSQSMALQPPYVVIQFDRPVSYTVHQGNSDRSIDVYIPITPAEPPNK